jgi:hypothetical protein
MDSADAPRQVGSGGAWRAGACRWEKTERIRVREHQGREVVSAADVARVDDVRWGPRRHEGRAQTSMASAGSGLGARDALPGVRAQGARGQHRFDWG